MPSHRVITIAGWILAAIAVAGCLTLGAMVRQRLAIEGRLREDPLGLSTLPPVDPLPPSPRLLLTGDSRAAHLGQPWCPGWSVINRGIAGQSAEQVAARLARDLLLLKPDHVVVIAGINDLKDGPRSRVDRAAAALEDVIRLSMEAGVPVSIIEVWGDGDISDPRRVLLPADLATRVAEVNQRIRDASQTSRSRVITAEELLSPDGTVLARYAADALHLNDAGNAALTDMIRAALPEIETTDD